MVMERARQMLRDEGFSTCGVDSFALFAELRGLTPFDLFVIGVHGLEELRDPVLDELDPLVVLVPRAGDAGASKFRVALPGAHLVDRELRDPDALRRVVATGPDPAAPRPTPDAIRETFLPFGLSERQLEVLSGALLGETSREIAAKLFISELTVRNHLHAIYERVGVSGRRQLLGRFVQGLIEANA